MKEDTRIQIENKLHNFANYISINPIKEDISLMSGIAGEILFLSYYSRHFDKNFSQLIEERINYIFDKINSGFYDCTLANGISGIMWLFEHLNKNNFIDIDIEALYTETDEILYDQLIIHIKNNNYDFLHGAIGIANYFVSRDSLKTNNYIESFIKILHSKFKFNPANNSMSITSKVYQNGHTIEVVNFSLSHGMTSIIYFLDKFLLNKSSKNNEVISNLINQIILYMNKNTFKINEEISIYPSWITKDNKKNFSRLSWCYGDLTIAYTQLNLKSNKFLNKYSENANNVLDHTLLRKNLEMEGLIDSAICHGYSGLALIYNELYKTNNKKEYKIASNYWLGHVLNDDKHSDGVCGYKFNLGIPNKWSKETGLLEGISGIGLTLLSLLDEKNCQWKEILML